MNYNLIWKPLNHPDIMSGYLISQYGDIRNISKDDVLKITRCILNHKHDKNIASIVVRELSEELPQLTVSKVNHILYKNSWKSLTDEYFMKGDFI